MGTESCGAALNMLSVKTKAVVIFFVVFEILVFIAGYGLDISLLRALFWISLIFSGITVGLVKLQVSTKEGDEQFESPILWMTLSILGFGTFAVLLVGLVLAASQGSSGAIELALIAFGVFGVSAWMSARALDRMGEWRLIKRSRKMTCPACGGHVSDSRNVCPDCGAIVFWVPSW